MAGNEKVNSLETKQDEDPGDFLLSNPKYHDCHLTVGFPDTDDVERIGVSSSQLIAHSPVFRDMLADSQLADPTGANTRIKDVSPAMFKLMLRHIYGGKLPKMTAEEAAELALCADKYNIQRLVGKAVKRLKPTNAEDVFPALICAAYINCPVLELQVSKIIQQQTDKLCQNHKFLLLNENCLLFVVKQSALNINELQLWNEIVRWGENQVKTQPGKTLRDCLNKILQHIRLLTLKSYEILNHVLPKKVLSPEEFMDLTLAVTNKQILQSPGLCKEQNKRGVYTVEAKNYTRKPIVQTKYTYSKSYCTLSERVTQLDTKDYSSFKIIPKVNVEINTLTVSSIQTSPTKNDPSFKTFALTCYITIYKTSKGHLVHTETLTLKCPAVVPNENIVIQVKKSDKPLILEAGENYYWKIRVDPPLPVHKYEVFYGNRLTDKTTLPVANDHFTIKYEDFYHILGFEYSGPSLRKFLKGKV